MPAAGVRELLGRWGDRLAVAAVNGPAATVVSGDAEALAEFEAELSARRVLRWRIPASDFVAHSARVEGLAGPLAESLAPVRPEPGQVRLFSTVHGRWMDGTELDAGYWYANLRQTVRFADAVRALAEAGHRVFVEVSPHPVLTAAITETLEETGAPPVITGTLDRQDPGAGSLVCALARVHVRGAGVDWAAVLGGGRWSCRPTRSSASGTGRGRSTSGHDGAGRRRRRREHGRGGQVLGRGGGRGRGGPVRDARGGRGTAAARGAAGARLLAAARAGPVGDRGLAVPGELGAGP